MIRLYMNKVLFLFGFAFLLISCSSHKTIAEYFADIEISEDPGYGYSAENPIKLRVGNQQRTIQEMYAFLSGLRKMDGNPLKLVGQAAVKNPNYDGKMSKLSNRYTGERLSYGNGLLLDRIILVSQSDSDTIQLYFNTYVKEELKIPQGLMMTKE